MLRIFIFFHQELCFVIALLFPHINKTEKIQACFKISQQNGNIAIENKYQEMIAYFQKMHSARSLMVK